MDANYARDLAYDVYTRIASGRYSEDEVIKYFKLDSVKAGTPGDDEIRQALEDWKSLGKAKTIAMLEKGIKKAKLKEGKNLMESKIRLAVRKLIKEELSLNEGGRSHTVYAVSYTDKKHGTIYVNTRRANNASYDLRLEDGDECTDYVTKDKKHAAKMVAAAKARGRDAKIVIVTSVQEIIEYFDSYVKDAE